MLGGEVREKTVKVPIENVKMRALSSSKSEKVINAGAQEMNDSARHEFLGDDKSDISAKKKGQVAPMQPFTARKMSKDEDSTP